jgi:plasmid stability protein
MANLQVKNLPNDLHAKARARADAQHLTLSAYVARLIQRDVSEPSLDEWLAEVRKLRRHDDIDIEKLMDEVRDEIEGP